MTISPRKMNIDVNEAYMLDRNAQRIDKPNLDKIRSKNQRMLTGSSIISR